MAGRAEVDELDRGLLQRAEQDVLGLEVAVDEASFVEDGERVEELRCEDADQTGAEALE